MAGTRKAERLTRAEWERLLAEYDALPRGARGKRPCGAIATLARRWGVAAATVATRIKRRKRT